MNKRRILASLASLTVADRVSWLVDEVTELEAAFEVGFAEWADECLDCSYLLLSLRGAALTGEQHAIVSAIEQNLLHAMEKERDYSGNLWFLHALAQWVSKQTGRGRVVSGEQLVDFIGWLANPRSIMSGS